MKCRGKRQVGNITLSHTFEGIARCEMIDQGFPLLLKIMEDEKSYFAVFFDVDLPMTWPNAEYKRITREKYINLSDTTVSSKTIEIIKKDGSKIEYNIVTRREFYLLNSTDNSLFLICDIRKVYQNSELEGWLSKQMGLEKINDRQFYLWYPGHGLNPIVEDGKTYVKCYASVLIAPYYLELEILPLLADDTIGRAKGECVLLKFKS